MKEKLLISACLMGTPCRYDGASKPMEAMDRLCQIYDLIPVCPEVLGGLSTPRLPCEIFGGKVIRKDGKDESASYRKGAEITLAIAQKEGCTLALFKEKSPSCGTRFRYDGTFSKRLIKGQGITAKLLSENGIKVYSENEKNELL